MRGVPDKSGYALVTGGAMRIGAVLSRRLSLEGWRVVVHYNSSKGEAERLAGELQQNGVGACHVKCDLASSNCTRLFEEPNREFGYCSLLVNSASVFEYDDVDTLTGDSLDRTYAVNLRAPILLSQAFAKQLPRAAEGVIVNILDQKVQNLNPDFLSYTVMKSGLAAFTKLAAMALAPRIRVCGIAPGLSLRSGNQTDTGFAEAHSKTPLGFGSTPADIADALMFVCQSPAITGSIITVDAGQSLVRRRRDVMFTYGALNDSSLPTDEPDE